VSQSIVTEGDGGTVLLTDGRQGSKRVPALEGFLLLLLCSGLPAYWMVPPTSRVGLPPFSGNIFSDTPKKLCFTNLNPMKLIIKMNPPTQGYPYQFLDVLLAGLFVIHRFIHLYIYSINIICCVLGTV
jgi:hypothetical protein